MAESVTLNDLIEAIANSVIGAQDQVDRYQISNLRRFFDENNRPVGVEVCLPKLTGGDGEEVSIRVPLLALVPQNRLSIKDVEISMDVELGALTSASPAPSQETQLASEDGLPSQQDAEAVGWRQPTQQKSVTLDVYAPRGGERPGSAKVTMKLESCEPPEGLARLMLELNKRIGIPIGGASGNDSEVA